MRVQTDTQDTVFPFSAHACRRLPGPTGQVDVDYTQTDLLPLGCLYEGACDLWRQPAACLLLWRMLNCLFVADKMGSMCLTIKYLGVLQGNDKEGWQPFTAFYLYMFGRRLQCHRLPPQRSHAVDNRTDSMSDHFTMSVISFFTPFCMLRC